MPAERDDVEKLHSAQPEFLDQLAIAHEWAQIDPGPGVFVRESRTTPFMVSRGSRGVVRSGWRAVAKNLRMASGSAHKQDTRRAAKNSFNAAQ